MDWEDLLKHPDDVDKTDASYVANWKPSYLPEGIRKRWGSWNEMWREMEGVAWQIKRKICSAHPPDNFFNDQLHKIMDFIKNLILSLIFYDWEASKIVGRH